MSGNSHHYGRRIILNAPPPPSTGAAANTTPGIAIAAAASQSPPAFGSSNAYSAALESSNTSTSTTPLSSNTISNHKKRKTIPGSRGVANLTPEQLAKKRANDREAQRAIRERQRLKLEQYEREIRELKSQQPYQELQVAIRQKEAAEAELAEVKQCLAAIMAMVQPVLAGTGSGPPRFAGQHGQHGQLHHHHRHHRQPLPVVQQVHPSSLYPDPMPGGSAASPAGSAGTQGRWHSSASPVVPPASVEHSHHHPHLGHHSHGLDVGGSGRLGLDYVLDSTAQKIPRTQEDGGNHQDGHDIPQQYRQDVPPPVMIVPPVPPSQPTPLSMSSSLSSAAYTHHPAGNSDDDFTTLHRNCPPTCPLDFLLLNTLSTHRQLLHQNPHSPPQEILGPPNPSVASLLNPQINCHPLSRVFTDILARFPLLSTLPERVGILYLMFTLVRWQIWPSKETWDRIPPWFRPSRLSREKDHPAWIDHIPFPEMRERVIKEYEPGSFPFDNFFIPFTGTLCLNWGYEEHDVLLKTCPTIPTGRGRGQRGHQAIPKEGGGDEEGNDSNDSDDEEEDNEGEEQEEMTINPVFIRHLSRLESWTLGEEFERAFPGLVGTYNLRRGDWKPPPPPPPPPVQQIPGGGNGRR